MSSLKVIQPGAGRQAESPAGGTAQAAAEPARREPGESPAPLDLAAVYQRLGETEGPERWRSLEELADTPEFRQAVAREFPRHYFDLAGPGGSEATGSGGLDRRRFLGLAGASVALAGLAGCTKQPPEKIVPYVRQPEEIVPGKPLWFATSMTLGGYARPLLGESHMGRPTKVEGNPEHPASLGATDLFAQATVLGLYDPDRAQAITHLGQLRSWDDFAQEIETLRPALEGVRGQGLRILSTAVSSPTLLAQIEGLLTALPEARWHVWEPAAGQAGAGARLAFGERVEILYDFSAADVVLTLDADPLTSGPGNVRYARDFADRRRVTAPTDDLNRLYAVESTPTLTGAQADHRLALPPAEVEAFALALVAELGVAQVPSRSTRFSHPDAQRWVGAVARDLTAHRGRSLVVAGEHTPPALQALVHALNEALGNAGATVFTADPVVAYPDPDREPVESLRDLVSDMREGRVDTLLILGGNPVYDAPADLGFAAALDRVGRSIYLGPEDNETAGHSRWMIPESHGLETWSDGRAYDGTATFGQPLVNPLYDSRDAYQVLALFDGRTDAKTYELVAGHWKQAGLSDAELRRAIHDGFLADSAPPPRSLPVTGTAEAVARLIEAQRGRGGETLELLLRPDPTVHDGRFANNGWLQECPKPLTKLTWDNALLMAPALAARLGLANEEVVRLVPPEGVAGAAAVEVPVWVLPGQAEGALTLHLGYGRRRTGVIGSGIGTDANPLRTSEHLWSLPGVTLETTRRRSALASTQDHFSMEGRHQVRTASLGEFRRDPEFAQHVGHGKAEEISFFPAYDYSDGHAWGLAVDLNACTGCNACVVACQAENNIPTVGKQQVLNGREMHWIRIDRYYEGSLDDPAVVHQPVMCQQCELAPCELVCPVEATVHSDEGLNDMVYNRCVGTRYCSNNCPYKVRRFNFLEYNDHTSPVLAMLRNPDVTVRERGVMEKCTYCVQRINGVRQTAKVEEREIKDGEIRTACQQVCPSRAIVFGDLNDEGSEVRRWKSRPTHYGLLAELNTRPRTGYLARVKNLNTELEVAV